MAEFDVRSFIGKIDENHEIRVGRVLLSLMRDWGAREDFACRLVPLGFNMQPPQLMAAVNRIMKKIHLDQFASVTTDTEGNVAIVIKASDLAAPAVQENIATMLEQIHQQAGQLGI